MDPLLSYLLTFLGGVAVGAGGKYFADKFTDRRRELEAQKRAESLFQRVQAQMPKLIAEMKDDFSKAENSSHREFIVARRAWVLNNVSPCLAYYEDEHPQINQFMMILENNGLISDVSTTDLKRYRFAEEFVVWLKRHPNHPIHAAASKRKTCSRG